MQTLIQDLRYGLRSLAQAPGFTAVAVIALALGIGATTAIFSVVDAILLQPLPYHDPSRLVGVWERNFVRDRARNVVSPGNFLGWRDQQRSFERIAAFVTYRSSLTSHGEPVEVGAQAVTADFFPTLGVAPAVGRVFTPEEDTPGNDDVVVISHRLWESRFGRRADVLGLTIGVSGVPHVVVGVMPASYVFLDERPDIWLPIAFPPEARIPRGRYLRVVARLKPGVALEQAQTEMATIGERLRAQFPEFNTGWGVNVVPLLEQQVGDARRALLVLLGAVGFVLLIACANVANLLLARGSGRRRELAVRTALGAGRGRLVRQLLTESVLLSCLGGAGGLALAWLGVELLTSLVTERVPLPRVDEIGIDATALGFATLLSVATGAIFGVAPAIVGSRLDLNESLRDGGRGAGAGRSGGALRSGLVIVEIALALVLLTGAGLLIRSFIRLQEVNPGFRADGVLTMRVQIPSAKYREPHTRTAFYRRLTERLGTLPGVRAVGSVTWFPFIGLGSATTFRVLDRPAPPIGEEPVTDVRAITGRYFQALGIPVIRGRDFTEREHAEAGRAIIVNDTLARQFWPDGDAIGKRLAISWGDDLEDEIVGVVGDARYQGMDADVRPMIYWPHARIPTQNSMTFAIRTDGDPLALASSAIAAVHALDPEQPVADVLSVAEVIDQSLSRSRLNTVILGTFAAVALILAAVGIYGVMAYSVTQRTHEFGVRMALGAGRLEVLRMVLRQGLLVACAGVAIGLGVAYFLTRVLTTLLFGVTTTDPATFAGVSIVLVAIALAATYVPARRATRVDPMVALRYE
jgi:putative ABC transport system permease protein